MNTLLLRLLLASFCAGTPPALPPETPTDSLRILTFNVAGIPIAHPHESKRIQAIVRRLQEEKYDLVMLQEVWLKRDAEKFVREAGMPYSAYHQPGLGQNGLLTLSRFPILKTGFTEYTCKPPFYRFLLESDALEHKGALAVRIRTPLGEWDVYNTHLIADAEPIYPRTLRIAQLFELFELVEEFSGDRPFLIAGDLNFPTHTPEYEILDSLFGLTDLCRRGSEDQCGPTSGDSGRIDYLLVADRKLAKQTAATFEKPFPHGSQEIPYSDHKAVEALLSSHLIRTPHRPDPDRQIQALRRIEERIDSMLQEMEEKVRIPFYGFFHSHGNAHLSRALAEMKERVVRKREEMARRLRVREGTSPTLPDTPDKRSQKP